MNTEITVAPTHRGYIPFWCGAELNAPAAQISALRTVEVRGYTTAVAEFGRRHFRVLIEGPEGSFGWDFVPYPMGRTECALAVNAPDWGEFFDSLRVGPTILCQISDEDLARISSSFPAAIGIPGGIYVYPSPAAIWAVDDTTAIVNLIEPGTAWHRDEVIDVGPGLYRAQRIKGAVLRE